MVKPWLRQQPVAPTPPAPPPPPDPAKTGFGALVEAARADFKRELTQLREEFLREVATIHANHAADMKIVETALGELRSELAALRSEHGETWDATHPPEPYPGTPPALDDEETSPGEDEETPAKGVVRKPPAKKRKR